MRRFPFAFHAVLLPKAGIMLIITVCCAIPSVLAREGQPAMRIACVGDDATFGTNLENREADCHPAQLSKLLGSKHEVANFGKTGAALPQKGTLPYKDSSEHRKALRFNPNSAIGFGWFVRLMTNAFMSQISRFLRHNEVYL
jgi:hypothetical protein